MSCVLVYFRPVLHADIVISHKEPVTCCMYNPSFKQVVTCSESSVSMLLFNIVRQNNNALEE